MISKTLLLLLFYLLHYTLSINVKCSSDSNCPNNSVCYNKYCQCNNLYILNCNQTAQFIMDSYRQINLTNETQYFQTLVEKPKVYYSFLFQLCGQPAYAPPNYHLDFMLYVNNGDATLGSQNFVGSATYNLQDLSSLGKCIDFVYYEVELQSQPNGQTQNLIMNVSIQPNKSADFIDNCSSIIQMKVVTTALFSSDLIMKLSIGIISAVVAFTLTITIYCCYRRWKKRRASQQEQGIKNNMVEEFKKYAPQILAKSIHIPKMSSCSICLGQFQSEQKVRKLVCNHIFHTQCIDQWCVKNLNCPVCRLTLSIQCMNKKKKQMKNSDYQWQNMSLISVKDQLLQTNVKEVQQ